MYTRLRRKQNSILTRETATRRTTTASGTVVFSDETFVEVRKGGPDIVTQDVEIADFHKRRANGELFFNPFNSVKDNFVIVQSGRATSMRQTGPYPGENWGSSIVSHTTSNVFRSYVNLAVRNGYTDHIDRVFPPHVASLSSGLADLRQEAHTLALANVAATEAQLMVSLAEMKQTVTMLSAGVFAITSRLAPLRDFYRNLINNRYTASELSKAFAQAWLVYRYGILPLVYELEGVVKALMAKRRPERETARGNIFEKPSPAYDEVSLAGTAPYFHVHQSARTVAEFRVRAGLLYEASVDGLAARLGLHPSEIPSAAWELTKLSFVVDWFVNLGNWIRALTASIRGNVLGGVVTVKASYDTYYTTALTAADGSVYVAGKKNPTTWALQDYQGAESVANRLITDRVPAAASLTGWPVMRVKLSSARVADGCALIAQAISGLNNPSTRMLRI